MKKIQVSKCDRCSEEAHYLELCKYCSRHVCRKCQKSSARASKIERNVICKDCWGNLKKRRAFKSA